MTQNKKKRSIVSNDILLKAAKKHGLYTRFLDGTRKKVLYVTDKHKFFVSNSLPKYIGIYPTNVRFTYDLFRDKAWCKQILKKYKYRTSRGEYFYLNPAWSRKEPNRTKKAAYEYASRLGYPVFVKPNNGSQGNYATIVYNQTQLRDHLRSMKHYTKIFLIEKIVRAPEYRIFILDGKPMFSYRRERSAITGDGRMKIIEILDSFGILPTPFVQAHLRSKKMTLQTVLRQGDTVDVLPVANISQGSKIKEYNESFTPEMKEWCKKLSSLTGTHIIGVDVFAPNGLSKTGKLTIIELNHQPSLVGIWELGEREKVFEIWDIIFKKFFGKHYKQAKQET